MPGLPGKNAGDGAEIQRHLLRLTKEHAAACLQRHQGMVWDPQPGGGGPPYKLEIWAGCLPAKLGPNLESNQVQRNRNCINTRKMQIM